MTKSLVYELILALVSLWLIVDSIKKGKSQRKRPIFFIYFTKRYFHYYIIILPPFGFKSGYGMAERSEFILTEIKVCYNTND